MTRESTNSEPTTFLGQRNRQKRLEVRDLCAFYGEAQVLKSVSLDVHDMEVVSILGSNGAGKTTLLRSITGLLAPRTGKIAFETEPIHGKAAHEIIRRGIASVPEGRELFGTMTVWDNLLMGTYSLPRNRRKRALDDRLDMVYSLFPVLKARVSQRAETLSGGEQQMLSIGRALMAEPKLLALDEPSLGLSPILVTEMMSTLKRICSGLGVSLLLVEQNARAALKIADQVYLLERGKVVLAGPCQDMASSPMIRKAYLGG